MYLNWDIKAELREVYISVLGKADMEASSLTTHLLSLMPVPRLLIIAFICFTASLATALLHFYSPLFFPEFISSTIIPIWDQKSKYWRI